MTEAVKAECYHRALLQIPGEFQTPTEMNKSISCSMCLYMCSSGWNVLQTETEMTWKKYFVYNVLVHIVGMCGRGTSSNTLLQTQTEKSKKKSISCTMCMYI